MNHSDQLLKTLRGFKRHFFSYKGHGLRWIPTPKAASTTMRQVLPARGFEHESPDMASFPPTPHVRFGVWRHPVEWIKSLYKWSSSDKFEGELGPKVSLNMYGFELVRHIVRDCNRRGVPICSQWLWYLHMDRVLRLDHLLTDLNDLFIEYDIEPCQSIGVFNSGPSELIDFSPEVEEMIIDIFKDEIERHA